MYKNFEHIRARKMQDDIVPILCKLEKIFPLASFDVMIHLAVHYPWEARIVGSIGYSWMYSIEMYVNSLLLLHLWYRFPTHAIWFMLS